MRVGVLGVGAVGARAVRQLATITDPPEVVVTDRNPAKVERLGGGPGADRRGCGAERVRPLRRRRPGTRRRPTPAWPRPTCEPGRRSCPCPTTWPTWTACCSSARSLASWAARWWWAPPSRPGLSGLLARYAGGRFDSVDEIHVAAHGTGGPACARQHHRALAGLALVWQDGMWIERASGSGRELCWFPEPVDAHDCYRAELADPLLLVPAFPGVRRVSARLSATRRDRVTARLPMLRRPHPEGTLGGLRVEVRGTRDGAREVEVLGAIDRPAVAAGAVAAVAVTHVLARGAPTGVLGMADARLDTDGLLAELAFRGVKAARYIGAKPELIAGRRRTTVDVLSRSQILVALRADGQRDRPDRPHPAPARRPALHRQPPPAGAGAGRVGRPPHDPGDPPAAAPTWPRAPSTATCRSSSEPASSRRSSRPTSGPASSWPRTSPSTTTT